jgi:hypothetical protein
MSSKRPSPTATLVAEGVEIHVADGCVRFAGAIAMRDPSVLLTPFLKDVHLAVVEARLKKITVDLRQLRFMNSSSIRSLVDWIEWIRHDPEDKRYTLQFMIQSSLPWQNTTLSAIQSFGGELVVVVSA